jgi:putative oxidoreductase
MFDKITRLADLPARAAMSSIFIVSALGKASAFGMTQGYMEVYGVPGALLAPTIAFEFVAGMALLVGFRTRYGAFLLAGFSLLAAAVFHRDFSDRIQQIMLLKKIAMAGGLLLLAKTGAPGQSIESLLSRSRGNV